MCRMRFAPSASLVAARLAAGVEKRAGGRQRVQPQILGDRLRGLVELDFVEILAEMNQVRVIERGHSRPDAAAGRSSRRPGTRSPAAENDETRSATKAH